MALSIGVASVDITPDRPCRMGGYNRAHESEGVLDPIELNVLVAEVNDVPLVLAVIDSIMVSESFARTVQARVAERLDIPTVNTTVAAVHTHSAPAFFKLAYEDVPAEDDLTRELADTAVDAIADAWRRRLPATAALERVTIDGLYGNRNVQGGPADKTCTALTFTGEDGNTLCKLLNISMHPTILNGKNYLLSADLMGQMRRRLEDAWGCPVVCTNGTCGDVSTRFYRQGSGVEELMRTADELAGQIVQGLEPIALKLPEPSGHPVLTGEIRMPAVFDAERDPDWLAARENARTLEAGPQRAFMEQRLELKRRLSPMKLTLIAHYAVVGNLIFITMPSDTVSALGLRMKYAFAGYEVIIVGYANTYCNYLVPHEDYGKYFETWNARVARGVADEFVEHIIASVRALL